MPAAIVPIQDTIIYKAIKALKSSLMDEFDTDGIKIRSIANKYAIDTKGFSKNPTIVMQGPDIEENEEGHQSEVRYTEITPPTDPKTYTKTSNQELVDLVFRLRVFAGGQGALARAWLIVNKIIRLASKIVMVNSLGQSYNVYIRNNFTSDSLPNISNLIHLEGELVIEAVEIDGIPSGVTYEVKSSELETSKKE